MESLVNTSLDERVWSLRFGDVGIVTQFTQRDLGP